MALTLVILTLVLSAVIGAFLILATLAVLGSLIAYVLDRFGMLDDDVYIEINKGHK